MSTKGNLISPFNVIVFNDFDNNTHKKSKKEVRL